MTLQKHTSRGDTRSLAVSLLALLAASSGYAQATTPAAAAPAAATEEEVVVLSPFIVDASKDHGYQADSTLAGSRMNTKLSDLGPSISVVTKQLLDDTASVDINDIFRYEINTEGSLTYTPTVQSARSDGVVDVNAGVALTGNAIQTNATANRVRGLGSPTYAINYYPSIAMVPVDSYNVTSIEINRGPNSMLFGMGSPAGIVNQSTAQAMLGRSFASLSFRFDSNDSFRSSFSFNRELLKDRLSVYGAVLVDERRFVRKPSYDNTRRLYGAITFKPFSTTTIRANVESYKNDNRRPNTLTPRDFVTQWNLAGQPVYDSQLRTVMRMSDGKVLGKYVANTLSPFANDVRNFIMSQPGYNPALRNTSAATWTTYNGLSIFGDAAMTNTTSVMYAPGMAIVNQARTTQQIYDGQVQNWFQALNGQRYRTSWGNLNTATPKVFDPTLLADLYPTEAAIWANPTSAGVYNRSFTSSNGWNAPTTVGSYKYPGVTDKAIYNWDKINLNQMNFGADRNMTYNVELEQKILDNLYLNAGWFRQEFKSTSAYTVAQLNVTTLFVDTSVYLPNGTLNPFLGKVYVEDIDPDQAVVTDDRNQYRAMLAYTPDFTKNKGWTKWLGRHQILGLWSSERDVSSAIRRRMEYYSSTSADGIYRYMANMNDTAAGAPTGWNRQTTSYRRSFYLSGPNDPMGKVMRSSGEVNYTQTTGDITVYDYATGAFKTVNMSAIYNDFDGGTGRNERKLESLSAGMTNYLWKDRIVTTFGIRRDDNETRSTTTGPTLTGFRGTTILPTMTNPEKWVNGVYQTETIFNRWNYWDKLSGDTKTLGGVFKPFLNWNAIDRKANSGSQFWQFIRDFGLSYNTSDNFNAPATTLVDGFGKPLPKPTGDGKDYGFQFSLLDNKFFARVTWFEGSNINERMGTGTAIGRLTSNVDTNMFRNWCRTIAMINMGKDPTVTGFGTLSATEETQVQAAAATMWQLPYTYYGDIGTIGGTRTANAKGIEVQMNYNPVPNWTMRVTGGKQVTTYSDVLGEFTAWYNERSPVWSAARAATYLLPQYQQFATYTTSGGKPVNLTTFWGSYGYVPEIALGEANGNYNAQLYYDGVVAPQAILARDLNGQAAPGQRRYRGSFMTNYTFVSGRLKGFSVGGGQRWEDRAIIGYYGKSSGANINPAYVDVSDVTRPIYDTANWYTDLWIAYNRSIFKDKVRLKIQLNVDNVFEDGGLKVTAVNYDASPYSYRIVDSRLFKLTTTFDF